MATTSRFRDTAGAAGGPQPHWVALALWGALATGLLVRALHLIEQPTFPAFRQPEVDAWYYHEAARRMAAGDWLQAGEPPRMSPGYAYFLGLVYAVLGDGPWAIRIVQIALGLATVALIAGTARRLLGARWALLPAWIAALYGPYVYFEGHLLPDALGAFLYALVLWRAVVLALDRPTRALPWAGLGLAWGIACTVRPNALLLLAPLLWACFELLRPRGHRVWAVAAVALMVGGAAGIAPLTLRNLAATGEVVAITVHGGVNFYVGNGPGATGTWRMPHDVPGAHSPAAQFRLFHEQAERALGRKLSASEADRYWLGRTADAAIANPGAWLRLMLRKLHLFWNGRELHNVYDYEFWRVLGVVLGAPLAQFAWIAPLGLVGTLLALRGSPELRLLALFNLAGCAAVVMVFVTDRYRLPSVAGILVAGTALLRELVARWRAGSSRAFIAVTLVAVALATAVAIPVPVNKRFHEKYHHVGSAWLAQGQLAHAEWALLRAIEADPRFLPAHRDLATVYERAGNVAAARRALTELERRARAAGDQAELHAARERLSRL